MNKYITKCISLCIALTLLLGCGFPSPKCAAAAGFQYVLLSQYSATQPIGGSFCLVAISSKGKVSFRSSSNAIASVNARGQVTCKKSGEVFITASTKYADARCKVTVLPTAIRLNRSSITMENGGSTTLRATASNGHSVSFKSNKSNIAKVSASGVITAKKPGEAVITVSCDGTKITCPVTVKKPHIALGCNAKTLYRGQSFKLTAKTSSGLVPTYKSSRSSVATVGKDGTVKAIKHGTASIKVKLDGVTKVCTVTVASPQITLNKSALSLSVGKSTTLTAKVSSGNTPVFSSSNTAVASVTAKGVVTGRKKGTAYIYAAEDGTKAKCKVKVHG